MMWIVAALVIIAAGALVYYYLLPGSGGYAPAPAGETVAPQAGVPGTADDAEADLQGIDTQNLDAELGDIEKELAQ